LDLLDGGGDPRAAVRTVFSWSIQHLPPDAAATFRLLGLYPGTDIGPYAAAALAGISLQDAHRRLELLTRAHVVQSTGPGRYGMHDLLRAYAAELAHTHDTGQIRHAALSRLLDHYRHTASMAMDAAHPYERERRPRIPPADTPTPDLSDPNQAISWLDTENHNLLAAARHAADHGFPGHAVDLSAILARHLRTRGRYSDAETLHRRTLTTARTIGDRAGELNALCGLGWVHMAQGRHEQAIDHYQQALEIARATGARAGKLDVLSGLAYIHLAKAQHEQAADHYQQVLEVARAIGHRTGELAALNGLAHVHRLQGQHDHATDHHQQALEIARTIGHRTGELNALNGLARVHLVKGQHERAADRYQQVLDLAQETGDRNGQFEALQGLGRLSHTTGGPDAALALHRQALELATDLGQPDDQARAHDGLAHAHHALNQPKQARQHWQHALDILTGLGTDLTDDPEANTSTIRARLAALGDR
jgi:tetratricopeptide (TPR) repeat protein